MSNQSYAFAVASVRTKETKLLSISDIEQLLMAKSYDDVISSLKSRGFTGDEKHGEFLKYEMEKVWGFIKEIAPSEHIFHPFIIKNDFHNLKAVLKCSLSRIDPSSYFLSPSVFSPNDIKEAILNKNFDLLPDPLKECGKVAYDILVRTQDGQLVDVVIDSFMLSTIYEEGKKIDNKFIKSLIFDICDLTNLKIALRCAKLNKSAEFLNRALIDSPSFSKEELVENSLLGLSHFLNFVRETKFSGAASAFEFSISNFETWCDNYYFDKLESAKYIFLGPEPICAYLIYKEAEIKNLRIVLSGVLNKLPPEMIREKLRRLYV